jgi:transposase, IS6 family
MSKNKRPALFRGRHFQGEIIVLCLRWYLRYSLSYRDLEEMMAERGLSLDHSTIGSLGSTLCADSESTDSL